MPIEDQVRLSVKFGEEEASEVGQESEREVIFVREDDTELDMSQIIYDYACLALPKQRTHEEGGCNPETMKYYGVTESRSDVTEEEVGNPFAALKGLFK